MRRITAPRSARCHSRPSENNTNARTIQIRVTPRAKQNKVQCQPDGTWKVYVTAPPEDGRANEAVVKTIAEWLGVKRRQVEIISGSTNRNKVVAVTGITQLPNPKTGK